MAWTYHWALMGNRLFGVPHTCPSVLGIYIIPSSLELNELTYLNASVELRIKYWIPASQVIRVYNLDL